MQMTPFTQALVDNMQSKGYSPYAIATALGNAQQENSLNTNGTPGDGGASFGGFQWKDSRHDDLVNFAVQNGKPWDDPDIQAKFHLNELETSEKKAGAALKGAQSLEDANNAYKGYLRYGDDSYDTRLQNAQQWYQALTGGQIKPGSPQSSVPAGPQQSPSALGGLYDALFNGQPGALSQVNAVDGLTPMQRAGDAFTGLGASLMARDNPAGAAALMSGLNSDRSNRVQLAQLAMQKLKQKQQGDSVLYKGGQNLLMQRADGTKYMLPTQPLDGEDDGKAKATAPLIQSFQNNSKSALETAHLVDDMNSVQKFLMDHPDYNMNLLKNGEYELRNRLGKADENSAEYKNIQQIIKRLQYTTVQTEKGPVTGVKLIAAQQTNMPGGAENDPMTFLQALDRARSSVKANYGTSADAASAVASTTKGLDNSIRVNDGTKLSFDDFHKKNYDGWNAFDKDYGLTGERFDNYKKNHFQANGGKKSFYDFATGK